MRRFREPHGTADGPTKSRRRGCRPSSTPPTPLDEPDAAALIAQYDGAIAYADEQLGRLVEALRRAGQLDRTLVVVTADHGEEFYEHRNWRHGNQLYNEVVHVPLLFRLPGRLPAARRADLSMLVDVFPTIVGLVDGAPADEGAGRSRAVRAPGRAVRRDRRSPSTGGSTAAPTCRAWCGRGR